MDHNQVVGGFKPEVVQQVFRRIWLRSMDFQQQATNAMDPVAASEQVDPVLDVDSTAALTRARETSNTNSTSSTSTTSYTSSTSITSSSTSSSRDVAAVTKINPKALELSAQLLAEFVVEAFHRAQTEAMIDARDVIEPQHLEQIVAQLLLDF